MTLHLISNLPEDVYLKLLNTEDALAAANYPASGGYIDVKQFVKFGFIFLAGALDSATTIKVRQDTAATETAIKDVSGATLTVGATGDDKWYAIEVETRKLDISNGFHFVTLNVAGPTGDDYGAILFYGIPDQKPVTQPTGTGGEGSTVIVAG